MHPTDLQQKLKKLNPFLEIRRYCHRQGLNDGVYYMGRNVCAVPQGYIWPEEHKGYKNLMQVKHRSLNGLADILYQRGIIFYRDKFTLLRG